MSLLSRLRNAIRPRTLDDELRAEMADHLARRAAALQEKGMSANEAEQEASRRFGNLTQLREQSRDFRLSTSLETTLQDLRYAIRGMRKSPAFAVTAILSLALAIGANTAIYSIVDAALLRPLPVPEPDRLFTLATPYIQEPGRERPVEDVSFSYPLLQEFRAAAGDAAHLALFSNPNTTDVRIPNKDAPIEKAICQFVSGDSFDLLGVPPALGRVFSAEDDRVAEPNLVISYDYWQRRFQADPHVLGQHIQIAPQFQSFTIVGVARKGFFGVEPGKFTDVWRPAAMSNKGALTNRGWGWFRIFGRQSPGVTRSQLLARLQPVFRADQAEMIKGFPLTPVAVQNQYRERPLLIHPGKTGASNFQRAFERPLWIVLAVTAGILLIACANLASLLLARSTARASEMAMRLSLGAARSRLIRQLLTESLLLSLVAGALGWIFARAAAPALIAALSSETDPVRFALSMDTRVLLFCAAVSTLAAVFFGLLPAWQASAAQPMRELHGMRTQASKLRLGRVFVGIQVAFAFTLVIAGSSFLFSLKNLFSVDAGFNPHNIFVFYVDTELSDVSQKPELNVFVAELQRRIDALPGVQSAAIARFALFEGRHESIQVILPNHPLPDREENSISVSPLYFSTMRIPLLAGREFEPRDRGEGSAVIVTAALARRYFGMESAVGKTFDTLANGKPVHHEIVGVVADTVYGSLREGPQPIVYGVLQGTNPVACYIRSPLDPASLVSMVNREARAMGHGTRVWSITTLDTLIGRTLLREKLLAGLGGVFAFLGLLLAAIGLFGLLNYSVVRRTKEIGIRAALGARPPSLVYLVLKEMFGTIAGGLIAGLAASLALATFVRSLLFGIRPVDPLVMTTAAAIFLTAAFIAAGLPASRAASIDPMVALRHE
ncbi:MAG TPA: ABC transporter permease [Bryobacteraceae bacterium]|jgi:predicted permease|nr:ABC transporter permease [Bryobacteraceae bacterium]